MLVTFEHGSKDEDNNAIAFWKPDPRIWFMQLDSQFSNTNIVTDQTKYDYVARSIEEEILTQETYILTNPPEEKEIGGHQRTFKFCLC